ncbi:hypothetical protein GCM10023205_77040 [Yinghuangia aomiensis]|uniref:Uncharacterized protein n=1 Tax=Yinghuangia aomiensis TaxID=676205 RepID=A0ABP9IA39_9ACTN
MFGTLAGTVSVSASENNTSGAEASTVRSPAPARPGLMVAFDRDDPDRPDPCFGFGSAVDPNGFDRFDGFDATTRNAPFAPRGPHQQPEKCTCDGEPNACGTQHDADTRKCHDGRQGWGGRGAPPGSASRWGWVCFASRMQ